MARPEDTLARGNSRTAEFDQNYDDAVQLQRRDPRRPFEQRPREEPPLRAEPQRTAPPRYEPYVPPQQAQSRPLPDGATRGGRAAPLPPEQPQVDPYAQQRLRDSMNAASARIAAQQSQGQAPLVGERRFPPQPAPERAQLDRSPPQGRPGATARPPAPPAPAQAGSTPGRHREPQFASVQQPPTRQAGPSAQGRQQPARGYAQDGYGEDAYAETAGADDQELDYDDDDDGDLDFDSGRPKGRRVMFVLGSILAAAVIGGGLGVAYKYSAVASAISGKPPIVQADKTPAKTQPAEADASATASGGKKTILDRPGTADAGNADQATVVPSQEPVAVGDAATTAADGSGSVASPRKVATIVVKPGEKIAAPATSNAALQVHESVPGISLAGTDEPAPAAAAPPKVQLKSPAPVAAKVAPPPPETPEVAADDSDAATADNADPAATQVAKPGKKPVKVASVAPDPAAADGAAASEPVQLQPKPKVAAVTSAPLPKNNGGGYLIQVRSTKSQADALAYFADLQQSYGPILGGAQPDIQEVDLGAKGKWFRLRIGPPGSGSAAKDMCARLKASGLKDCIVAAY